LLRGAKDHAEAEAEANHLFNKERYGEAKNVYQKILDSYPDDHVAKAGIFECEKRMK
jgi:hypothetical protein